MRNIKRIAALLTVLLLLGSLALAVSADAPVPMLEESGSIRVSFQYQGNPVPGGEVALYRVGSISNDGDNNYSFYADGDFASCGQDLKNIQDPLVVSALSVYIRSKNLQPLATQQIKEEGMVLFTDLQPGLYLIIQTKAAPGYSRSNSFLVSLPNWQKPGYVYDVDASPKVFIEPTETTTRPTGPTSPTLPQTGQNNWPVPVFAAMGLAIFTLGWYLTFGKKQRHEK